MDENDTTFSECAKIIKEDVSRTQEELEVMRRDFEEQNSELESQSEQMEDLSRRIDEQQSQLDSLFKEIDARSKSIVDRPDTVKQSIAVGVTLIIGISIKLLQPVLPISGPIWEVVSVMLVGASGSIFFEWATNSETFRNL